MIGRWYDLVAVDLDWLEIDCVEILIALLWAVAWEKIFESYL